MTLYESHIGNNQKYKMNNWYSRDDMPFFIIYTLDNQYHLALNNCPQRGVFTSMK